MFAFITGIVKGEPRRPGLWGEKFKVQGSKFIARF